MMRVEKVQCYWAFSHVGGKMAQLFKSLFPASPAPTRVIMHQSRRWCIFASAGAYYDTEANSVLFAMLVCAASRRSTKVLYSIVDFLIGKSNMKLSHVNAKCRMKYPCNKGLFIFFIACKIFSISTIICHSFYI